MRSPRPERRWRQRPDPAATAEPLASSRAVARLGAAPLRPLAACCVRTCVCDVYCSAAPLSSRGLAFASVHVRCAQAETAQASDGVVESECSLRAQRQRCSFRGHSLAFPRKRAQPASASKHAGHDGGGPASFLTSSRPRRIHFKGASRFSVKRRPWGPFSGLAPLEIEPAFRV